MVQYKPELDKTLAAIADSNRRAIVDRLGRGSATVSELAETLGMTLTGTKKHLGILEEAGLITTEKVGRSRVCSLGPRRLDDLEVFIETYRQMLDARLDRLGELLEKQQEEEER